VTIETSVPELDLADWRRRVAKLYVEVRALRQVNAMSAWEHWRTERETLFREHPQSPVPAALRAAFRARHWAYNRRYAFELAVEADAASGAAPTTAEAGPGIALALPVSGGGTMAFRRIGFLDVPFPDGERRLALYWMEGYAGGLFLPFRDATNGHETYGAGRYLLDAAKSADLGADLGGALDTESSQRTLVLDFNFAYHPSCAFDPKWACPLAPPENRLDLPVPAGERLT
jgi:uncharacterized protein (DUF1684 family)